MILISAERVLPITRPALENAALVVKNGKITELGPRNDLKIKFPWAEEFHHRLLMPGLINAHTHLNFSCSPLIKANNFPEWLVKAKQNKLEFDNGRIRRAAKKEIENSARLGVTSLGDILGEPSLLELHKKSPLFSTIFYELIGIKDQDADAKIDFAKKVFGEYNFRVGHNKLGLAPHTPFTASKELFRAAKNFAKKKKLGMCAHLAESREEVEFIMSGTGPVRDRLFNSVGWKQKPKPNWCSPAKYLEEFIDRNMTLVHCVEVSDDDLEIIANSRAVVHCLRSNLHLTGKLAPIPKMIKAGITVALGTDSPASAGDMNLWDEMKAVFEHRKKYPGGEIFPLEILKMATINAALAIFRDDQLGSIEPGKTANLLALNLPSLPKSPNQIATEIITTGSKAIEAVYIAGKNNGVR